MESSGERLFDRMRKTSGSRGRPMFKLFGQKAAGGHEDSPLVLLFLEGLGDATADPGELARARLHFLDSISDGSREFSIARKKKKIPGHSQLRIKRHQKVRDVGKTTMFHGDKRGRARSARCQFRRAAMRSK